MLLDYASDLKIVRHSSLVWLCAAICLVPVDAADSSGLTIERLLTPGALPYLVEATYLPRAWIAVVICAGAAFAVSMFARKWTSLVFVIGISMVGVLAPVIVNQVLVGPDHDFGGDAAIIGTPVMAVVFGVLLVFVFRLVSGRGIALSSGVRFFRLAGSRLVDRGDHYGDCVCFRTRRERVIRDVDRGSLRRSVSFFFSSSDSADGGPGESAATGWGSVHVFCRGSSPHPSRSLPRWA